jgi:menaquinone-dependent protoporphyrinogen oxidase
MIQLASTGAGDDGQSERSTEINVLVAVASKHGSTRGIAEAIATELRTMALTANVRDIEEDPPVDGCDAAIIGSAIYMGDWLPEARRFVDRNQSRLAELPVWLFSSGPLGQGDQQPKGEPSTLDELMNGTGARGHRVFAGKLDKKQLGLGERLVAKLVKAPQGDFRDWPAVRAWAREIGTALSLDVVRAGATIRTTAGT